MQRLFTTFAGSWLGFGLLVQRLVTGIPLLHDGIGLFKETPTTATIAAQAMGAVPGISIMMGLWTPVAGALIVAVEMWTLSYIQAIRGRQSYYRHLGPRW